MPTKIINNFTGRLTRDSIGEMNSGYAKYQTTFGNDPFSNVSNLSWLEAPIQIDSGVTVIQDEIMCARPRLESGVTYVYAVGHTGRVYKIQVNDPSGHNANYDNPVLLTTLASTCNGLGLATFKYGSSLQFFGDVQQLYICHDHGVTRLNFDGTGEAYINGSLNSDNQPRPSALFLGSLFVGSGSQIVQISGTPLVITANVFPSNLIGIVRDMDVSPDGNYLQIIASRIPPTDMTVATQDTSSLSSSDSYKYFWNGIDTNPSSFESYNAYSLTANSSFGSHTYTMGYDLGGGAMYTGGTKLLSFPNALSPSFGAMFSTGNMLGFGQPDYNTTTGKLGMSINLYGQYDNEVPEGLFRFLKAASTFPETDVLQVPVCLVVSNLFYGSSTSGYANNQVGAAKVYFSTLEVSSAPTIKYRLYKFTTVPTGTGTAIGGVYETQNETSFSLFRSIISKKFKPTQVRFYVKPLASNNSFKIDLIGSDGNPISGGSQTFTVGSGGIVSGQDYLWYTPQTAPTYSIGVRITNLGINGWTGVKLELDYEEFGQ